MKIRNKRKNYTRYQILNTKYKLFCLLSFVFFVCFLVFTPGARAEQMESSSYEIDMSNLNMTSGRKTDGANVLTDTVGQNAPGKYTSTGYIVKAGFQYIHSIIPFSFTISDLSIDFGSLTPGTPSTAENTLTVSAGSAGGWQVSAWENHELRTRGDTNQIKDTECNGNGQTCTPTDAKLWDDNSKYGFGYRIAGDDIDESDWESDDYYRPFANNEDGDPASVIMESSEATKSAETTVTYKVNVSTGQAAGEYQNYIVFSALPTY